MIESIARALILACVLYGIGPPLRAPSPWSGPQFTAGAPVRAVLRTAPLGFDADGNARWLVRVVFHDASGRETMLRYGGDVDFDAPRGDAQWQTRMRFAGFSAIVKTSEEGPLSVDARINEPKGYAPMHAQTDTRSWPGRRVAAATLGPHLVQIGWFPREARSPVRVLRTDRRGNTVGFSISAPSSYLRDATVKPGRSYAYRVVRDGIGTETTVVTPPAAPRTTLDAMRGKGMWLYFSSNPSDPHFIGRWNVTAMIARAACRNSQRRTARRIRGVWQVDAFAKPYVDAFTEAAHAHHIAVLGWTVPRAVTAQEIALNTRAALYRTRHGERFDGLAVDFETGPDYMGDGPVAYCAIVEYARLVREALGRNALIVATVIDPTTVHWGPLDFPWAGIARYVDVLQPMTYWRTWSRGITTPERTRTTIARSIHVLRAYAGRNIAIDMGGQTTDLSPEGPPPGSELRSSIEASRRYGAIGEMFFDWDGTSSAQWDALAHAPW
ncbi:MAG: hypothetical protein ACXVAM_07730 [Vulcanimicrobiaceae bacterium]